MIDEKYTRMLMARTDLDLLDVIALDKVQKGKPISEEEFKSLKEKKLIEGRRPNLFVSAEVAAATETRADYIKKRAFDKDHYKKMVVAYLEAVRRGEARGHRQAAAGQALGRPRRRPEEELHHEPASRDAARRDHPPVEGKRGKGAKWQLRKPATEGLVRQDSIQFDRMTPPQALGKRTPCN